MKRLFLIFFIVVLPLPGICRTTKQVSKLTSEVPSGKWQSRQLDKGWKIKAIMPAEKLTTIQLDSTRKQTGNEWYSVSKMPMMVHDVLLENGKIETPWLPGRAEACKWVAESDWIYSLNFPADPKGVSYLRFNGMDVMVDIYLNGKFLVSHSNMHLPLRIDVTNKLKTQNSIVIHFHTTFKRVGDKMEILNRYKGAEVRHSTHNYDNYLGAVPYFSRIGVYDDIALETTGGSELSEVLVDASLNKELTIGTVTIDASGTVKSKNAVIRAIVFDPYQKIVMQKDVPAKSEKGRLSSKIKLQVPAPQLWWPRGYGEQSLYRVEVSLVVNNELQQVIKRKIGFRNITMPEHLHFMVNGKRVWLWGADYVIPHWQTAVYDKNRVEQLFMMAAHANMNTLRTWADVEAAKDNFYELADSLGFLIWNDFPQLYQDWQLPNVTPEEKTRERILSEATYWIKKLKHHPSIFLWSGGNEEPLWNDPVFNGFKDNGPWAFESITKEVGAICKNLDSSRVYLPTSPYNTTGYNDPQTETHGYTHLWYVPGYDYINFASEDTRISAPTLPSLKKFIAPEDLWPADYNPAFTPSNRVPFPKTWLIYAGENSSYRKTGPVEQFYDPVDAASVVQRMGMAASLYYRQNIERQRRGRPVDDTSAYRRCGGYLVWKLNDSWPEIYSGKIDYFMEPYHDYYEIRRAFSPVILSFEVGNYIWLWAVNDSPEPVEGTVNIQLFHLDLNKVHKEITKKVIIQPGESKVVVRLDEAGIGLFRREHILSATLTNTEGKITARAVSLADIERHIKFPDAKLTVKVHGDALEITTDKFAHTVTLEGNANGDELGWFFEDNYFDVMPGQTKTVHILGKHTSGTITAKPWYSSTAVKVDYLKSVK